MSANQATFPIALMARVLGVSESGFHAWRRGPASAHAMAAAALLKRVRTIHAGSRATYGVPRVQCRWYNPLRLHSALGCRSTTAYEAAMETVNTEP